MKGLGREAPMKRTGFFPKPLSPLGFRAFQTLFGLFLAFRFLRLLPDAPFLLNSSGSAPALTRLLVLVLAALSLVLALGRSAIQKSWLVPLLLALGHLYLIQNNPWVDHAAYAWTGWLLLATALSEKQPSLSLSTSGWLLLSLAILFSGVQELSSLNWTQGYALPLLLSDPLARDTALRTLLLDSFSSLLRVLTWGILAFQLLFPPLALFPKTRKFAWVGMLVLCLGSILFFRATEASLGMGLFLLFLFDESWLPPRPAQTAIVFFDGVCGLCNRFVDFLLQADTDGILELTPLQGQTAETRLPQKQRQALESVVLIDDDGTFEKSEAVLRALSRLGGFWRLAAVFRVIPRALRDAVYDTIASNRYSWFGKRETCRLPTAEEKARFLP